jgi:hypothetical protein
VIGFLFFGCLTTGRSYFMVVGALGRRRIN